MKELIKNIDIKNRYELLERKAQKSKFIDQDLTFQVQALLNEVLELQKEITLGNISEIKKELLDVLYNQGQLLYSLEKKGVIDTEWMKQSGKEQKDKIIARSPFLKEGSSPETREEERAIRKQKKQQIK